VTVSEISAYHTGVLLAACLTRLGVTPHVVDGPYGVPRYDAEDAAADQQCSPSAVGGDGQKAEDYAPAAAACRSMPAAQLLTCLERVFTAQTSDVAPEPLQLFLGAVDQNPAGLLAGPALASAAVVAVLALAGTALVTRRLTRPILLLTQASRRLGQGALDERVAVTGKDELAELSRSFNRMADSLQRAEERQRRLVADVAHELRTPLSNIRGYLEALREGVITADPELFASLHDEAVLQQRIVDDLQDLALAEAGTLAYHRSRVDVTELLEVTRAAHHAVADAAGVRLRIDAPAELRAYADPDRLRQVLGNLVGNAVRHTPADGTVALSASQLDDSALIRVSDTGSGISEAELPHVFDRLWRADAARGRDTGGSGLGLTIARRIVTDHGGTIEVSSRVGVGTTFSVRLPLADPAAAGA
jgi:two-component system sensor histidine kinase BaeS